LSAAAVSGGAQMGAERAVAGSLTGADAQGSSFVRSGGRSFVPTLQSPAADARRRRQGRPLRRAWGIFQRFQAAPWRWRARRHAL